MPAYYATPLRRALTRMGAGNLASSLVPETLDNCLSYTVLNYLKRLKNQVGSCYVQAGSLKPEPFDSIAMLICMDIILLGWIFVKGFQNLSFQCIVS